MSPPLPKFASREPSSNPATMNPNDDAMNPNDDDELLDAIQEEEAGGTGNAARRAGRGRARRFGVDPMPDDPMESVRDRVQYFARNPIAPTMIQGYDVHNQNFWLFCYLHNQSILTDLSVVAFQFGDVTLQENPMDPVQAPSKAHRQQLLEVAGELLSDHETEPILFDALGADEFMAYLLNCQNTNGSYLSYSAYNNKRAALFHLFRVYGKRQSQEFRDTIRTEMQGLKRSIAHKRSAGVGWISEGKDPMSYATYRALMQHFWHHGTEANIFTRTFMVICWHLMCHACNVVHVFLTHMVWCVDAMGVYFGHTKSDQGGEWCKNEIRHLYANPFDPIMCPFFNIGTYFICFPSVVSSNGKLFPGSSQYARFGRGLIAGLRGADCDPGLDLGAHSIRKGATTYVTSGLTAAPSYAAVAIRAGWTLGSVVSVYMKYDAAGDQYVGWTVAGLNSGSS